MTQQLKTSFEKRLAHVHEINSIILPLALIAWVVAIVVLAVLDLPNHEGDQIYKPITTVLLMALLVYGVLNIWFGFGNMLKTMAALAVGLSGINIVASDAHALTYFVVSTALYGLLAGAVHVRLKYVRTQAVNDAPEQDDVAEANVKDMMPNWLKLKKEQFDDVDVSHNTAAQITALSYDEFYSFYLTIDHTLFVIYLSTLSPQELQKFFDFFKDISVDDTEESYRKSIQQAQDTGVSHADKARATLEVPLCIQEAKYRVWIEAFQAQEFTVGAYKDEDFIESEQNLNFIIARPFCDVPTGLAEYFATFQHSYRDDDKHRAFAYHLADKVGGLCHAIEQVFEEEPEKLAPLVWFRESFVENREQDTDAVPWKVRKVSPDNFLAKLIRYQCLAFGSSGIWDGHAYHLLGRIYAVGLHLEWFPINKQQVYEGLQAIMQYIGEKEIDEDCADAFIALMRDDIPAIYGRLSFASLMDLKEHINVWIAKYKPHENKAFSGRSLIVTNYFLDLEDLFLENDKQAAKEKLEQRYILPLAEYMALFEPFQSAEDLAKAGLWNEPVIIDSSWDKFDGVIRNKQDGHIGWDETTVTADIFDMSKEIPVWFEKVNGECFSVGIPIDWVKVKKIDYDNLRKAPAGLYRLIGYDTYDYSEHLVADFGSLGEAIAGMELELEKMKAEHCINLVLYNDKAQYLMRANHEDGIIRDQEAYLMRRSQDVEEKDKDIKKLDTFSNLLKRGNLPDDDREVPNWLKIKNRQFDDVDVSHNTVDDIIALSSEEFNEFVSNSDSGMLFTYLSTLSESEMDRFYRYNDEVVKLDESQDAPSAKEQFQAAMEKVDIDEITDEQRARATLEMPLMINFSKNIYHQTMAFRAYIAQDYYAYEADDAFKMYEGNLVKIIWDEMKYIPNHFEQVLDHFQGFYDEENIEHKKIFAHLANRFGKLIAILNNLVVKTEERTSSLNWFTGKMVEYELLGSVEISISQSKALPTDQKLINFLSTTFLGICDEHEDNYLSSLIHVVETMFEWYPVNQEACEYAMVEMMKSVAVKKVSVENANRFLDFFAELPRFYAVLNYDRIYELKELICHTLETYKLLDNEIFDADGVKNKLILLNYKLDMEDLYYESGQQR